MISVSCIRGGFGYHVFVFFSWHAIILTFGYYYAIVGAMVVASPSTSTSRSGDDGMGLLQQPMFSTHESGVNLRYDWRIQQLKTLKDMLENPDNLRRLQEACKSDLGRTAFATIGLETFPVEGELRHAMRSLKRWMKPKLTPSSSLTFPSWSHVIRKPLPPPGVLIIGAYNYPAQTVLRPLVGALAAGNPVVIKPSERCPKTAQLLKELIERYFDPTVVQVVLGGIPETTELLSKPWSKVVFTGSGRVGRIVAESCARTLSPCLLELGGKCPLVVDETVPQSDLRSVAERIVFGKFANAGQTCLAVDTVFVHVSHVDRISESLLAALSKQFGNNPQTDGELGRIVNKEETQRILDYLLEVEEEQDSASSSSGNQRGPVILCGGSSRCDVDERYIDPTILLLPANSTTKLAREEIFGPVLPIIAFSNRNEAIQNIQSLNGIPLQLYVFTPSKRIYQEYTDKCRSAGSVRNDCLAQGASCLFPLGGLGSSGIGRYGGWYTYEAFSHPFHTLERPLGCIWDFGNFRCHPYAGLKERILAGFALKLPGIPVLHIRKIAVAAITSAVIASLASGGIVQARLARIFDIAKAVIRRLMPG